MVHRHRFRFPVAQILLLATLFAIAAPARSSAQCTDYSVPGVEPTPFVFDLAPDGIEDLALDGPIAWTAVTIYGHLAAVDLTDPYDPQLLGSERVLIMDETYDVAISGDRAFVTYIQWGGPAGVRVFDISDPADPVDVGDFVPDSGWPSYVAARGDLLYVSVSYYTFAILDVSDPAAPQVIGSLWVDHPWEITLDGDLAYVATDSRPQIIDVGDPTAPQLVGELPTTDVPNRIAVGNGLAWVATDDGMEVFDVSDPTAPLALGSAATPRTATFITISADGSLAYVPVHSSGLHVFDVRDPATPALLAVIDLAGVQWGRVYEYGDDLLVVGNGRLYVLPQQCALLATAVTASNPRLYLDAAPNPFNPRTNLRFELPAPATATVQIFDAAGRLTSTLVDGEALPAGVSRRIWNGTDDQGRAAPSGSTSAACRPEPTRRCSG